MSRGATRHLEVGDNVERLLREPAPAVTGTRSSSPPPEPTAATAGTAGDSPVELPLSVDPARARALSPRRRRALPFASHKSEQEIKPLDDA